MRDDFLAELLLPRRQETDSNLTVMDYVAQDIFISGFFHVIKE